jgi:hypothetical protein
MKQEYNFQYPIDFISEKQVIKKNVLEDLELTKFNNKEINQDKQDNQDKQGIMEYVIQPKTIFGKSCLVELTNSISTDVEYLKQTQIILKKYPKIKQNPALHNKISSFWFSLIKDDIF